MSDEWTIHHNSQSNPVGHEPGDVPALLRRVADSVQDLGDVQVQDITFASQLDSDGMDDLTMTVYYNRETPHLTLLQ